MNWDIVTVASKHQLWSQTVTCKERSSGCIVSSRGGELWLWDGLMAVEWWLSDGGWIVIAGWMVLDG